MKSILSFVTMIVAIMLSSGASAQTVTNFELDTTTWVLPDGYQFIEFEGKQALLLESTGDNPGDAYAYLKNYEFSDGTIEFDLYTPESYAYIGFIFRLNQYKKEDRYELFYFRPFQSNSIGAVQYFPVNNGVATFQYYTDNVYQSSGNIPWGEWVHVKAEIEGPRADIYINDLLVMTVNNLGRGLSKGSVGVWKDSTTPKCYYANFNITK